MNRLVRGSIMLAAAAAAWACSSSLGENPEAIDRLSADPSVLFVDNDDSAIVDIEALNQEGQQLAADFSIGNVGAGLTVRLDTNFLTFPGQGHSPTRSRFVVRAATTSSFVSSSFTISAGGKSVVVPVSITPANFPATFSSLTPAFGDTVVLTAPAPLTFSSGSTITIGTVVQPLVSISPDSSTASFIAVPGSAGNLVVSGLTLPYLASSLTLTTVDAINAATVSGTGDFATAPTLATPTTGQTITYVDAGAFAGNPECTGTLGGPCLIYAIDKGAGDIDVTLTWSNTTDLGVYFYDSGVNIIGSLGCDSFGAGAAGQPETCTLTGPAGTYYLVVDTFSAFYNPPDDVDPAFIQLDLTGL
jgi:hypothetical protein